MNVTEPVFAGKPSGSRGIFNRLLSWRTVRRTLISLAVMVTLIALFYTVEDWRGRHAWARCKAGLESQGVVMDWNALTPPPVPDDQNVFKAPKMQEWFVGRGSTELSKRLSNKDTGSVTLAKNTIATPSEAADYLKWSDQFKSDFELIRQALKRPDSRMEGDYEQPFAIPIPNFVTVRVVAQTLAQRTHCHLLLQQPEEALRDLTLLHELSRLLEAKPTGKPMTLVSAMIKVAITGLYSETIAEGFRSNAWREPELTALAAQLGTTDCLPDVSQALTDERVAETQLFQNIPHQGLADRFMSIAGGGGRPGIWEMLKHPGYWILSFAPRGWLYQNLVTLANLTQRMIDCCDRTNNLVSPRKVAQVSEAVARVGHRSPYGYLATLGLPNISKATLALARNQTQVNEAFVVCALERYRLALHQYPESLDALVPQFADKLPHDIIGGQPLHYRRTDPPSQESSGAASGRFVLYSIGWNEKDDGGHVVMGSDGKPDQENGDWVWPLPSK